MPSSPSFVAPPSVLQQKRDRNLMTVALTGNFDAFLRALEQGGNPHQNDGDLLEKVVRRALTARPRPATESHEPALARRTASGPFQDEQARRSLDRWAIVEHLIQVNGLDPNQDRAKVLDAPTREGDLPSIQRLIALGADPTQRPALLGVSLARGDLEIVVHWMREHGLDGLKPAQQNQLRHLVESRLRQQEHHRLPGWSGFQAVVAQAAAVGVTFDTTMARAALVDLATHPAGPANDVPARSEETVRIAQWLAARGVNLRGTGPQDTFPSTLMGAALRSGQITLFDALVDLGADPHVGHDHPMEQAALNHRRDAVRHLVQRYGADPAVNRTAELLGEQLSHALIEVVAQGSARPGLTATLPAVNAILAEATEFGLTLDTHQAMVCAVEDKGPDAPALIARLVPGMLHTQLDHPGGCLANAYRTVLRAGHTDRADALWSASGGALPPVLTAALVQAAARSNQVRSLVWMMDHGLDVAGCYHDVRPLLEDDERRSPGSVQDAIIWLRVQYERVELRQAMMASPDDGTSVHPSATTVQRERSRL